MSRVRIVTVDSLDATTLGVAPDAVIGVGGVLDDGRPLATCQALVDTYTGQDTTGQDTTGHDTRWQVWSFLAGPELDLLVGSGLVGAVCSGYLDRGRTPVTRQAIEQGTVRWDERSELMFSGALQAAARRLPCWLTRGGLGSDVAAAAGLRTVVCPYTGDELLAVPAQRLDVAIIKMPAVTATGIALRSTSRVFLDDGDIAMARAADVVIVETDTIVEPSTSADGTAAMPAGLEPCLAPFEVDLVVHTGGRDGRS